MARPQLSICIPTYNFGEFIGQALESLQRQYRPGVEVVILDGGSTDSTADVVSTAGDAALSVSGPAHLTNGTFSLADPLAVTFSKSSWSAPVSHDPVTIGYSQHIGANEGLRTGSYSTTLTFTLSTTNP